MASGGLSEHANSSWQVGGCVKSIDKSLVETGWLRCQYRVLKGSCSGQVAYEKKARREVQDPGELPCKDGLSREGIWVGSGHMGDIPKVSKKSAEEEGRGGPQVGTRARPCGSIVSSATRNL